MTDVEILRPLVDRVLELSQRPCEADKKELWARHNALLPTERIPVCETYEGIPGEHWKYMFGEPMTQCQDALARNIEFDLKRRIWMAENVPEDHIVWPALRVTAVINEIRGWGVEIGRESTGRGAYGSYRMVYPFADGYDFKRLTTPIRELDEAATEELVERTSELVDGRLMTFVCYPTLTYAPYDFAAYIRGMDTLMYDMIDQPQNVHRLMKTITDAVVADDQWREEIGAVNIVPSPDGRYNMIVPWRANCVYLEDDFFERRPRLSDEWIYVSAQISAGLGPRQYEEFVHRYDVQICVPRSRGTVYYHGCECLDEKYEMLATLPGLRRLHVSPWSSGRCAVAAVGDRMALEVHCHPGKVLLSFTAEQMRAELRERVAECQSGRLDLNLSDIHSINGNPETLRIWAEMAQEVGRG